MDDYSKASRVEPNNAHIHKEEASTRRGPTSGKYGEIQDVEKFSIQKVGDLPFIEKGWSIFRAHRIFNILQPWPGLSPFAIVTASLTQIDRGDETGRAFLGAATMRMYNVSPLQDQIWLRGEVDWDDDLWIRVNLIAVGTSA